MGFTRVRINKAGVPRYEGLYNDVRGNRQTAGTYDTEAQAARAWQRAEDRIEEGRLGDPQRGKQRFRRYVEVDWLPNHELEARSFENYTYYLDRYILPTFGAMRMIEVLPLDVRQWVVELKDQGVTPYVIKSCFAILSAVFTTALNDQITRLHPCRGVKTPPVPKKVRKIVTPEQFDDIYAALRSDAARMLVELDIETGLRWGELTELRPSDVDLRNRMLTVQRVVVEVVPKFHPEGARFVIKPYPKDREHRRMKLNVQVAAALAAYIGANGIGKDDLLFSAALLRPEQEERDAPRVVADPGLTEPNAKGRRYRHGTITAYSMAPCRCDHCRGAYAAYRARRRAEGKDSPRNPRRTISTDGHIPRRWFRSQFWLPAIVRADLGTHVRPHDLRHAHASWLLAGGADLQIVKERMGHGTIKTTEIYLHTLEGADETALDALTAIRQRRPRPTRHTA